MMDNVNVILLNVTKMPDWQMNLSLLLVGPAVGVVLPL